ncbi:MAG: hypothetical protein K2P20_05340 [Oscillospiraceae bacterium]|nr:hypothetical protein [Oscillospiraceae bacterium]
MYQIVRITDRQGEAKTGSAYAARLGCIGEAKMENGCVLFHCRYDKRGEPCDRYIRTSLVQNWKKDKGRIAVETLNSIYHMDKVDGVEEET